MDWTELAKQVAKIGLPLLGAVLPVPGGAAIGTALAAVIGSPSSEPTDIMATLTQSADARQKALEFQATHQEAMTRLVIEAQTAAVQAEAADRASAREAMVGSRANTPAVLSWIVVLATFLLYGHLVWHGNPQALSDIVLGRILGTLDTAFGVVLAFWLGTSFSSRQKDATISSMARP